MRAYNGFPLDDDIVDSILSTIDEFKTLVSFILSCKAVYNVYKRHPMSIQRSITVNQTGPAVAQALALVRMQGDVDARNTGVPIDEHSVLEEPPQTHELQDLVKNAKVVYELEDLFSWRHKDPSTSQTKLDPNESHRFHRAMYRYWIFCIAFGIDSEDDEDMAPPASDTAQNQQEYLNTFSDAELKEIEAAVHFARETIVWSIKAGGAIHNAEPSGDHIQSSVLKSR
ncbi:hypothetical protein PUNSTDRAFT_131608 [Punctularia strigosozonata HHB-11173 SS5]|uniref:uncharacterized protein n=1 Tax=Punctularia strigosozonata (strain HHB-11173) TaxID=741275 RepID=UPI000441697D|nr:uncharacterized protein PUNSTDRAFT_131608 [Punctularia strigosozonata HHB-11173 SS5]EIN11441.1 hypothetical protein PUNSTDRAFT_131608 [Punctularia strigosozonata HHB-11173 SS5]